MKINEELLRWTLEKVQRPNRKVGPLKRRPCVRMALMWPNWGLNRLSICTHEGKPCVCMVHLWRKNSTFLFLFCLGLIWYFYHPFKLGSRAKHILPCLYHRIEVSKSWTRDFTTRIEISMLDWSWSAINWVYRFFISFFI